MKLKVIHVNGAIEILTLVPPVTATLGISMNHLSDASGNDYYFTSEGNYDGWGHAFPEGVGGDVGYETLTRIEDAREFESGAPGQTEGMD